MELGVLGPLQVRLDGAPVAVPGAKPRAILTMLGLHGGSVVPADVLMELLWGDDPPRTAAKALQTHISSLRHTLGEGFVLTEGTGWRLSATGIDASRYKAVARSGRDALNVGDSGRALTLFDEALALWRGVPELPDGRRGTAERTRWIEGHAALAEDRADALLATGRAAEIVGELEAAIGDAPLRERRWGQLMLALYRAGRQGEALGAFKRVQAVLANELGVDPGPDLRRLEAAIVAQDATLEIPAVQNVPSAMRAVTFLLTDIEGSTAAWEADADAMALALARHDELVEQVVTSRGGRLIKTRGEGDATFSVFERPSAAAAASLELQDAILHEPWALVEPMRIRIALHTGEAELRDGDYFGRAVNRAARLRSLAAGGQILCSGATAELVVDTLRDDVALADLGMRELKNLARPEHVFELRFEAEGRPEPSAGDSSTHRPDLPAVLAGPGPFVGRSHELGQLMASWQAVLTGGTCAVLIAGEPGVGKTRLAGEWSRQAYEQGAVVLYGRSDEDLGAPYQPFAEALRMLVPSVGTQRLRGMRGVEALLPLVPALTDVLPDLAAPPRADPDTERYALFDAVVALLGVASADVPIVLVLDDLHWAAKPTLLLLRHLLRFGEHARVQIVGTYRSTDLDRSHPLAAMLADLHRDGSANRIALGGLDEDDVTTYVTEAGYDDELARALASVTGGNPFFLIEALRHVDESGGHWNPSTLPQGVREAVSRRLSRLPAETNKALAAAAVVGSQFALDLVERVVGDDLIDAFDEVCQAGIVIEEPGGRYRFNHAIVRQSLLAELASVRRMRLHQRIAAALENEPGADDDLLAELAHHYFECAWAGNALKAVEYCRRAADQAMARLAYEGAADLYDHALHALEEVDDELPDRDDQRVELLVARCEALLAAGDVSSAAGAVSQLKEGTGDSARLAAWATCFDGELSMLVDPERLNEIESAVAAAATALSELGDAAGEAKAHTVRAGCLARLGRVADCEVALDHALAAARQANQHSLVNSVLAGAPLAALWGPNPVPRAGGRCLDVVRLLRITTDSPAVEATSTRCQAVLEAFRGRGAAARRMIDSARRTVTELGLRHAVLEVEHFAGIVELVLDDAAAAEQHLRLAYNGFRRMGLDADTAEAAALLARACLLLDRGVEADELCSESERLAGHALKPSIAWRTTRAQLFSRDGEHDEARRVAEEAVAIAERTDALVDHGDACLALATVLAAAGEASGARAAAERAGDLYDRKGAVALAEKARALLGKRAVLPPPAAPAQPEAPIEVHNAAVQASERVAAAVDAEAWDEFEGLFVPDGTVESRRRLVGFGRTDFRQGDVMHQTRCDLENGVMRASEVIVAVRGERLALARVSIGTVDESPGAPQDELLQLYGIDEEGRFALQIWFDLEDIDAALAELDALHARFEEGRTQSSRLENVASDVYRDIIASYAVRGWDAIRNVLAENISTEDRRRVVNAGRRVGRDAVVAEILAIHEVGVTELRSDVIATRGRNLVLCRSRAAASRQPEPFHSDLLEIIEVNSDNQVSTRFVFDVDDVDAAFEELDARYVAGEAAPYARTWSVIAAAYAGFNRREIAATTPDWVSIDNRRAAAFAPGEMIRYVQAAWDDSPDTKIYIAAVHQLSERGAVVAHVAQGTSQGGFDAEWRDLYMLVVEDELVCRGELFDEADLDAALARFDELSRSVRRLENAASEATVRFLERFTARDWDTMAQMVIDDISFDDRRRVVSAGQQIGRDAFIENFRIAADLDATQSPNTIATRGQRLVLARARFSLNGGAPEEFGLDLLHIIEVAADNRISATVTFDPHDLDAAFEELDARYLAGEAAPDALAWSTIVRNVAAFNRREPLMTTRDWVTTDHRRATAFEPGDITPYIHATWDVAPDINLYIETPHRLSHSGALFTQVLKGTSHEGFDAEWRDVIILTVDGEQLSSLEVFDEADLDAALTRFDELSRPTSQLGNAAGQVYDRIFTYFASRDWPAMAEAMAEDIVDDDRRRVANAGIRCGRDAMIANMRTGAELGARSITSTVVATRGDRLVLRQLGFSGQGPEAFHAELLGIAEIDTDQRIVAVVQFDLDDVDAAFGELDARYLTGEAARHSHTWSAVMGVYAALNRRELPETTSDHVSLDHRRVTSFAPGDIKEYTRLSWNQIPDISFRIAAVHRLTDFGAVVTHSLHGTSRDGFEAEWRELHLMTLDGELFNRSEMFDEADLEAALARFKELSRPAQPSNAASRAYERLQKCFIRPDLDAMATMLADDFCSEDRRHIVSTGIRRGRDAALEDARAVAGLGVRNTAATVIAIRGERLALRRSRYANRDEQADGFHVEILEIIGLDGHGLIAHVVTFDSDDFDSAVKELDARYLAGEAAAQARTWSVIANAYAALNRRELPAATPNSTDVDHRRGLSVETGKLIESLQALWDITSQAKIYVETVHQLSDVGVVVTHVASATSRDGLDAEWRDIALLTIEGELLSRAEAFEEADLDTALDRFEVLSPPAPRLQNMASRMYARFYAYLEARDWDAMADMLADDACNDDRRRVVSAGIQRGRDAQIANLRAVIDVGVTNFSSVTLATRGDRLALQQTCVSGAGQPDPYGIEMLCVVEIDADNRIAMAVLFDPDDLDAAFEELDTRYAVGEAAAHARTWSVITDGYAALNRHELPAATPDIVNLDHRPGVAFMPGDLFPYIQAAWDVSPDLKVRIETTHRLNNLGAVVTQTADGSSPEGFYAEWRQIVVFTVDGDEVNRCEMYEEGDLDAALARFDELTPQPPT
ncbi:BTAD domain-containing putative transcriptional regulator [Mycobacterium sp. NPDC051198]